MEQPPFTPNYILMVWASTIIGAPVLIMLLATIVSMVQGYSFDGDAVPFIFLSIVYGVILSIPALIIFYFSYSWLAKRFDKATHLKLILVLIGNICILITFYVLAGREVFTSNDNFVAFAFIGAYLLCLTVSGLVFSIKALPEKLV